MRRFICFKDKVGDVIATPLMTRPLASFSVITFTFILMRLYIDVQPLLLIAFFLGVLLVLLKIDNKITWLVFGMLLFGIFLGFFSASSAVNKNIYITQSLDGQHVRVEGDVSSVPVQKEHGASFYVDVDTIYSNNGTIKNNFKLYVRNSETVFFGDRITFNAMLYKANSNNLNYIAKGAPLCATDVKILSIEKAVFPKNLIVDTRNYIINTGDKFFFGEEGMLFKALVAGDKSSFSDELTNNLSASGLSHIAAVSGLHVSVIGMAIFNLLKRRNRNVAIGISLVFVYLFVLITGASASVIRAAIMFTCFLISKLLLQENDTITSLGVSAMILAVFNPYIIFDWGFILSFLSVLGIQIFSPYFKMLFKFLPDSVSESISATIAAQIMTIPAITNMFGSLSLYSVLANMIVSAIFVITLYLCIIFVFVSFIPYVNVFVAMLTSFFLMAITSVAEMFASLPNSNLTIDGFNIYLYIAYFSLILMFIFRKKLSEYFVSAGIILSVILVVISPQLTKNDVVEYNVCENSVLVKVDGEKTLFVRDNLYDVYLDLKGWGGRVYIDTLVFEDSSYLSEYAFIKLGRISNMKNVVVPPDAQNTDFIREFGINIEYANVTSE